MWNFSFVFPTLLILTIILIYYYMLPHLDIRRNRVFIHITEAEAFVIVFDIISSLADNHYQSLPLSLTSIFNALFFAGFFFRSYLFFIFTVSVLGYSPKDNRILAFISRVPFYFSLVISMLSPIFGWIYYIDSDGYHSGPLYSLLYYVSLFYIAASFISFLYKKDVLENKRDRYTMILFNLVLLCGIVIRRLLPNLLLMDTFCLMAILVAYLGFENPEFFLDLKSTAFNDTALRRYLDEHGKDRSLTYFSLVVHTYNEMREIYGPVPMDNGLYLISLFLRHCFPKAYVFYFLRGRFVIIFREPISPEAIRDIIDKRFKEPWVLDGSELYLDANYSFYIPRDMVPSTDTILEALSISLSKADRTADNIPVEIRSEDINKAEAGLHIKECFESAIENDNVTVYLQPLVDIKTKRIIGAEALARIFDKDGNMIPPDLFIPMAESSGLINQLGEQVFEKTCRFISENDLMSIGIKWINVNLSPLQFIRVDLSDRFSDIAARYGVPPAQLHLEITEQAVEDDAFMQKQMSTLTDNGFQLVLDDYGTGYSNLLRLKKCPFVNIKIDRELVWDYSKNPDNILPTMVSAFKQMGFGITAEGIENEEMVVAMERIGCDYLQGYFYSKPISMDAFLETVKAL